MTERNRDGRPAKERRLIIGAACLGLLMLAAVCFVCFDTNTSSADPDSGNCGENLTWTFDGDHTLTITGTGPMEDYSERYPPWDDYQNSITTVVIGDGVTSVSNGAFTYYTHITSLTLGSGLQTIGDSAFVGIKVTELTIPDSVVSIGDGAFEGASIATLDLGSGVTSIGKYAFLNCKSLTALTLPDSVTSVGERAFAETHIATLSIGTGLQSVGQLAFDADELATIAVDENNDYLMAEDNVIYDDDKTKVIYYPAGLTATSLAFDDTVTEISNTIRNSHITSIELSKYVTKLCENPFDVPIATTIALDAENTAFTLDSNCLLSADGKKLIRHFTSPGSTFTVPDGVVTIEPYAFESHQSMTSVVLPASVTELKYNAFEDCTSLRSVSGGSVSIVGDSAFSNCGQLESFQFGESVTRIGEYAFMYTHLTSAVLTGAENAVIDWHAFDECRYMETITLSGGFVIGDNAFSRCGTSTEGVTLTIGNGVTEIGSYAFVGCKTSTITIPDSVTSIGYQAFGGCHIDSVDTTVTIGTGLTDLGYQAFDGCDIVRLNYNAIDCAYEGSYSPFDWSSEANEIIIVFGGSVQTIPAFFAEERTNLKTLVIPDSVVTIGRQAFEQCTGLTTLTIGEESHLETIESYAFSGCSGIEELLIPESMTLIGTYAFSYCTGLTDVTYNAANCQTEGNKFEFRGSGADEGMNVVFGDAVRTIGAGMFQDSNITDVVLPEGVTGLGNWVFDDCPKITAVTIPSTLATIGSAPFNANTSLRTINFNAANLSVLDSYWTPFHGSGAADPGITVNIGSTVRSVPDYLLKDLSNVNVVNMGANVTSIGSNAFQSTSITSIVIPSTVTNIKSGAFYNCNLLATITYNAENCTECTSAFIFGQEAADLSVTFGNGVETIPANIFQNCTNLISVSLGSGVTAIGQYAFKDCSGITALSIPASVESLGRQCFYGCTAITAISYAADVETCGSGVFLNCGAESGITLTVSEGVTSIPDDLFSGVDKIKSVTLPSTLVTIGSEAFMATSITTLVIPDNVTTIGREAFYEVPITSLTIGKKVESMDSYAFYHCSKLTSLTYNAVNCTSASYPFDNGDGYTSFTLTIGDQVETIPASLFKDLDRLTGTLTVPDSVTIIGDSAFRCNEGLGAVTLGDGVTNIGPYAFYGCTGIPSIAFGTADLEIGEQAFAGCGGVTSLTVPANVKALGSRVFNGMSGLTAIDYNTNATGGGNNPIFNSVAANCSVTFGDGVTTVPYAMFQGCTNLKTVNFNDDITQISGYAFHSCSNIQSIILPDTVKTINAYAFVYCSGLKTVVIPSGVNSLEGSAFTGISFYDIDGQTRLSINSGALSGYKFTGSGGTLTKCNTGFHLEMGVANAVSDRIGIEGRAITIADPEFDHYTFGGWFSDQELEHAYEITDCPDTLVTLYAKWVPDVYTVTFDSTGGTAVDPVDVTYPNKVSAPNVQMAKEGYTFVNWRLGGYAYDFNDVVETDITLVADWSANQYTVTLDGNGGSDGEVRVTFKSIALNAFESSRRGYVLDGYYSAAEDGVKVMNTDCTLIANVDGFTDGEGKWIKASNTTLYAQWTPRTFDLALDKNEGAADGSIRVTFDGGTSSFVAATKAGYHAIGYYTSANAGMRLINGDGSLVDNASGYVEEGKWIAVDSPDLYARWEADTISIVLDGNGSGSTNGTATVTFDANDLSVTLAAVRPGWDLTGYFTASSEGTMVIGTDGSVASSVASITDADGNWIDATNPKTLYAQWSPHQYNIVVTGGTSDGTATIRTGDTALSDVVRPENYGYSIAGIYDSEDLQILDKFMSLLPNKASYTDAGYHWIYTGDDTIVLHATWTPVWATLLLYGGDVQGTARVTYMSSEVTYTPAEKAGYTLLGYTYYDTIMLTADGHLVPNFTGFTDSEGRWIVSGGTSLASIWSPNEYAITLDKNGGTANGSATATFDSATLTDFVTVSRTGYELTGFFTEEEGGVKIINADGTLVVSAENHTGEGGIWAKTSDTTLYAQWQAKTYAIILDSNGGTSNGSATATYDAGLTSITDAAFTGYSLEGYYTAATEGTKVVNANGTLVSNVPGYTDAGGKWIRDENTWLYAGWTANEYTVTYNANGGEVDPATDTFTFGSSYELAVPTYESKHFAGWKDAQDNIVAPSGIWGIAGNVTLTAQWNDVETFEIRFSGGEGSQGQAFSRYEVSGEIIQLSECSFTKTGHDFTMWSDGENMYDAGANYSVTENVSFTAMWIPQSFWVTYLLDGNALGGEYQPVMKDYGTQVTVLPTFTYAGYDVTAWTTEDVEVSEGKFTMLAADVTFSATSTAKTYDLVLNKNDGTADGSATVTYDSSTVTSFVTVERTGYTLNGFFTAAAEGVKVMNAGGTLASGAEGYTDENGKWVRDGAVELYAQWTPVQNNVTLYGQGGTPDTKGIVLTYGSSEVSGYQAFTRDGYDLKGYYNSDDEDTGVKIIDANGELVKDLPQYTDADGKWIGTRNISLYAYWDVKTYDINIDNAGGQGSAKFTIVYGTSTVVGYVAPTRTGYTFAGYFTAASDGVKIINADGTLANATGYVTDGKWSKASDTVLFAQWQANTYGMSLDKNGGAVNGHVTATYGSSVLTNLEDATRYGYGVSGYYTAAEGGVAIIVDGKLQKDTAYTDADGNWDVDDYAILYAHWEPNQYTVTLNSNNGYADGLTKIAYETSEFLWFTHASGNDGYHLDGYFTQAEGGSMVISVAQLLQSNVDNFTDENGKWIKAEDCTLYAHWSPNVDGIILHSNGGTEHGHASVKYDGTSPYLTTHATRTGYSVEGYYTTSELEVKVMNADGTFVPNVEGFTDEQGRWHVQGDQTFYAKWTANIYDVGLLSALATLNGTAKATYGETSVNITMPPEYAYHHPEAYYTTSDLDVKVINADGTLVPNVPNFTDSEGRWIMASNTDVYVKWAGDLKHLVITYSYSDGSGQAFPSVDTYVAVGDSYSYDSPALEGYTPDIATVSGTIEYFDVTEWVRYAPNDYTITFVTNGGSDIDPYTAPYKSQIPEKETHRLGYDFAGWFSDESLQTPYELTTMPLGNITVYAKWTFTVYTIDYALGGGQNDPANPATFTMDTDTITLRPATRTGYTFGGWFADMGYTQQVTQIPKGTTLEYGQTLYFVFAKWTVNQYTITFDTQGGSPVASITKDYMAPVQTPANPTKDGYTFGGWMRDGSHFQVPPEMPAENIDLVALWVKVETSGSSVKVSVDAETVVIDTAIEAVAAIMNDATKTEVSVTGNGWTMDIPMEVVTGANGPVSAGAKALSDNDVASLPAEVQSLVQGKAVFNLSLSDSNGAITFSGKAIKVSLPYKLQDGEKASNVKVFFINENNQAVEVDAEYDEQTQCAVFSTDHFSTWYVDATASESGSGGGSNVGLIVGIIVGVLVVAAIVAVVVLVKTGKIGGAKGAA